MIRPHLQYLSYVFRHKWFVAVAGVRIGVPWGQLLIHDLSKFGRAEWTAYVDQFYGHKPDEYEEGLTARLGISIKTRADIKAAFDAAWNHHQKVNPHHWQAWVLITDQDEPRLRSLPMPDTYAREMVADWCGAGRAITGRWEVAMWYAANKDKMLLHETTRDTVEQLIDEWEPPQ